MNKKLRSLRKKLRHSKNSSLATTNGLMKQIESLRKELEVSKRRLSAEERDRSLAEKDHLKAMEAFKELECFRVAVNNAGPFRYSGACDIFNVQMQIDMRSFEFGMFQATRGRIMPMCKILDYVRYDLTRHVARQIEGYLKEKGINVQY